MAKNITYKDIPNFLGFDYLIGKNVPVSISKFGETIELDPIEMEKAAAAVIVKHGVALTGKEVHLLRSSLGLSFEKFARNLDLSPATVLKWEKNPGSRLARTNEISVRLYVAEQLGVAISASWSDLIADKKAEKIEFSIPKAS